MRAMASSAARRSSVADRDERLEILRGMIFTRATDNRLKAFFLGGEVITARRGVSRQGPSVAGQEAIYGAACAAPRRGVSRSTARGRWTGDVIAPVIRDLGATLAMRPEPETVRMVLNSQMAKAGPPTDGKDFGYGDLDWGILLPASPLTIATLTLSGMAMAFGAKAAAASPSRSSAKADRRSASGTRRSTSAPRAGCRMFCVQNNQTALSTPVSDQSAVRVFADKAAGYGVPGSRSTAPIRTIAGAFGWAAERARAGLGPTLIEPSAMRLCGHAHHDDMLYLGQDPQTSWDIHRSPEGGYANRELYNYWAAKDPIVLYAAKLTADRPGLGPAISIGSRKRRRRCV